MRTPFLLIISLLFTGTAHAQLDVNAILQTVHVKESNVYWEALLDSSSEFSIINASNIAVMNASFPMEKNVTRAISFKLSNAAARGRTVNGVISGVVEWNGQQLYTVKLEIGVNLTTRWEYHEVDCVLADLSGNDHKLILGKNWPESDQ